MKSGQKQLAIENYRKALEINPDNEDAKQNLKELESAPAPKN
jgi:tetratricopeptide (TPR) repeat protein